jgi:hypothetical protein
MIKDNRHILEVDIMQDQGESILEARTIGRKKIGIILRNMIKRIPMRKVIIRSRGVLVPKVAEETIEDLNLTIIIILLL